MTTRLRLSITGVTFLTVLILTDCFGLSHAEATGIFFRRRCPPPVYVAPCVPYSIAPVVPISPPPVVKEPTPPAPVIEEKIPPVSKDMATNVKNIADLLKRGKNELARKLATASAVSIEEVSDLMHLYRQRNKGGIGWGSKDGKNPATDGLEKKIQEFAKGAPQKDFANAEESAYWIAAIAELTIAKAPKKDFAAKKTRQNWLDDAQQLRANAFALAKASADNDAGAISKAAAKINSNCISCHVRFKD